MPDNDCFFVLNQQFLCSKSQATATSSLQLPRRQSWEEAKLGGSATVTQWDSLTIQWDTPNQLTFTGQVIWHFTIGGCLGLRLEPRTTEHRSLETPKWPSDVAAFQRAAIQPTGTLEAA